MSQEQHQQQVQQWRRERDDLERECAEIEASYNWQSFTKDQFVCPFCGKIWVQQNAPDGGDIICCKEIGHCEPFDPETYDED